MSEEEIEYCLKQFYKNKHCFIFENGLKISLYKVFEMLKDLKNKINKSIELNQQVIKDTKGFYRPTSDTIYSGDTLIDIATQNIDLLKGDKE